jgi:hypothetical protein
MELVRSTSAFGRLLVFNAALSLIVFTVAASSANAASVLDPRATDAAVRFFLSLCASFGLYRIFERVTERLPSVLESADWAPSWLLRLPHLRRGLVLSLFVVVSLPWSFPYWWEPVRMDPVYVASVPGVSRQHLAVAEAVRENTPPDAHFVAGPSYAPWIAALTGRSVLLDEGAAVPVPDTVARRRAARDLLTSRDDDRVRQVAQEWGITHVVWGRLDQPAPGDAGVGVDVDDESLWLEGVAVDFDYFDRSPSFDERFRLRRFARIYEYVGRR